MTRPSTPAARDEHMTVPEALDALVEAAMIRGSRQRDAENCQGDECRRYYVNLIDRADQAIATFRQVILDAFDEDGMP